MATTCTTTTVGRKVMYSLTSETEEDLECRIEGLLSRYHPMGYGTSFSDATQNAAGLWVAHGSRLVSCD